MKYNKTGLVTVLVIILLMNSSCSVKNNSEESNTVSQIADQNDETLTPTKNPEVYTITDNISGTVQKGPFYSGTTITYYELDDTFVQTGRSFMTQTVGDTGDFEINAGIELVSPYLLVSANGYYYDECSDKISDSTLTLHSIIDIRSTDRININVLTSLAKDRIVALIGNGILFDDAYDQAKTEVLNIFHIDSNSFSDFHVLDITQKSEENAALLAISIILQGYDSTGALSSTINNLAFDLKDNGVIDDLGYGSPLIRNARMVKLHGSMPYIRDFLKKRYESLNSPIDVPNFEKYIENFLSKNNGKYQEEIILSVNAYDSANIKGNSENTVVFQLSDLNIIEHGDETMTVALNFNANFTFISEKYFINNNIYLRTYASSRTLLNQEALGTVISLDKGMLKNGNTNTILRKIPSDMELLEVEKYIVSYPIKFDIPKGWYDIQVDVFIAEEWDE